MKQQEAVNEAQKRWGDAVFAEYFKSKVGGRFYVGIKTPAHKWVWKGKGDSWEAAFADADKRAME